MATIYWTGAATAVAQVDTGSIDTVDATPANNTFVVTIGDQTVSAVGNTDVATTATDLRTALNASTHPYFSAITWSGTGGSIIGTADTAGVPFSAALTVTGAGTGTVTDFASTTANAGPASLKSAANYSGGVLPGASDDFIIRGVATNICYDLDAIASAASVTIEQSFTGLLGLREDAFATTADGATVVTTAREYRPAYLVGNFSQVTIGSHTGIGSPSGSGRVKVHTTTTSGQVDVQDSATSSNETFVPPVRLLGSNSGLAVNVRDALVGIAVDRPGETATVGDISVTGSGADLTIGSGVTFTSLSQSAGEVSIQGAAATVTSIDITGGTLTVEGDFTVTTLNVDGGTVSDNHLKTSGNAITTANVRDGALNLQGSDIARTIATLVHTGGEVRDNPAVTFTTHTRARATISA